MAKKDTNRVADTQFNIQWIDVPAKPKKEPDPYALISTTTIRLNSTAARLLGDLSKVIIGIDADHKIAAIKAHEQEKKATFDIKRNEKDGSVTIRCASVVQLDLKQLGVHVDGKKRIKVPAARIEDSGILVLDFSKAQ